MANPIRFGLVLIVGILGAYLVLSILRGLLAFFLPIVVLGGLGLIVYGFFNQKLLKGARRPPFKE
jgi:hypothetical protein